MSGKAQAVTANRRTVSSSGPINVGDTLVAVTSTTAARNLTLPAANTVPAGNMKVIKDASGGAATNNITITAAGSDHIDAGTTAVINTNYGVIRIMSNGSNGWDLV